MDGELVAFINLHWRNCLIKNNERKNILFSGKCKLEEASNITTNTLEKRRTMSRVSGTTTIILSNKQWMNSMSSNLAILSQILSASRSSSFKKWIAS